MKGLRVVEVDGQRLRAGPWRGSDGAAYLAPLAGGPLPDPGVVRRCLDDLAAHGYASVLTAALPPEEQAPFLACGFEVREELHLMRHDLTGLPDHPPGGLRRAHRWDRDRVLEVDHRAFTPFWQLDAAGLRDARTATPVSRFRVNRGAEVLAYAVSGRALDRGYLQRLAVDPDAQGRGLGRALTLDALWWMRRRGARSALVNTQLENTAALALYTSVGFERLPEHLAVLQRSLGEAAA